MNKKYIAALFVVALMVCAAAPFAVADEASAEDDVVCKIGETTYTSFTDALAAATDNTKTIELLKSTTLSSAKPLNGNLIIKDGVTLTLAAQMNLSNGKNGTITINEGGELKFTGNSTRMYSYGTIVNNGTFTLAGSTPMILYSGAAINNNATINVEDATIQINAGGVLNNAEDSIITITGTKGKFSHSGTITNDGTINFGKSSSTINAAGVFTNNGTVTMTTGSIANSGKITNNGTFEFSKAKITGNGTIDGSSPIVVKPYMEVDEITKFVSGTGTVTHKSGQDAAAFGTDTATTMVFTVTSKPAGTGNWADFGTAKLTSITFKDNSDLIYIPSFIVGKTSLGSATVYSYYKITEIDAEVIASINEKTINIVLPSALKNTAFESGVTKVDGTVFTDADGNKFNYDITETTPIWYNGYTTYTVYANSTSDADPRYCEQGVITKVTPADESIRLILYKGNVQWAKTPMASPDTWVGSASTFGDIIGTAITGIALEEDAAGVTAESKLYLNVDNTMDTSKNTKALNTIVQKRYTVYINLGGTIYTTFTEETERDLGNGSWETVYGVSPEDALVKAAKQKYGENGITLSSGYIDTINGVSGWGSGLTSIGSAYMDVYLYPVQWILENDGWVISNSSIPMYSGSSFTFAVAMQPSTFDTEPTAHTFASPKDTAKYQYLKDTFNWAGWGNLEAPYGCIYVSVDGDDSIVFSSGVHAQYVTSAEILIESDTVGVTFYKKIAGDEVTYQKIREVTLSTVAGKEYVFRPVTVNVTNEGMTLGTEYTLVTTVYNINNTQVSTFNGGYITTNSVTYIVKDDENIRILLKSANINNYKSIQVLTMADAVKTFNVTFDNVADYRIYTPADAEVSVYKYIANEYRWDPIIGGVKEGTKTTFSDFPNTTIQLRVSGDDYVTASFLMTSANTVDFAKQFYIDASILAEIDGVREKTLQNRDLTAYYKANSSNIIVSGNFENFLSMAVDGAYELKGYKSISAYQPEANPVGFISQNLRVIEPDFTYVVMNLDGTPSDILTVDGSTITAVKEGLAVIVIGYNGHSYFSITNATKMDYVFYGAIWSENLDVIVVKVGGDTATISTNMKINEGVNIDVLEDGTYKYKTGEMDENAMAAKSAGDFLDSENDVLYYLDGQPGYYYSFTPETGCTVKVWNPVFNAAGNIASFTEGTVSENDGTFTVLMTEGRNIIQVSKDSSVTYQVASVKKTTMTVSYEYNTEDGKLYPGDKVTIKFDHVDSPQSRTGMYNTDTYLYYYIGDENGVDFALTDAPVSVSAGRYDFAALEEKQTLTFTIPEGIDVGEVTLKGAFMIRGFGSPIGTHHNPGVTIKANSAPGLYAILGQLPSITVNIEDYATIVYETGLEAVTETDFTSSYTLMKTDKNKDLGTIMVSKGDVIHYTLKTSGGATIGYINSSMPAGWTHDLTTSTMSSAKQVTFTFTATDSLTANIAMSWNGSYSFILHVLVMDGTVSTTQYVVKEGTIIDPTAIPGYSEPSDKAFYGWNTVSDASGTMYMVGDSAPSVGEHKLYAIFLETGVGFTYIKGTDFAYKYTEATQKAEFKHISVPGHTSDLAFDDNVVAMTGKAVKDITLNVDGNLTVGTALTLGKSSALVLSYAVGAKITGIVGVSNGGCQAVFNNYAATTEDITIGVTEGSIAVTGNNATGTMIEQSMTTSATVSSFSKDGKTTVVTIGSYDPSKAVIAGKITMTYGTYIEADNGVWYDPFRAATAEYDGSSDIVYIETDARVESCTIESEYSFMGKVYVTPSDIAGRSASSEVDVTIDNAITMNGIDVKKGDILQYGEYIITVKDGYELENYVKTEVIGQQTVKKLTYVGQKLIVNASE